MGALDLLFDVNLTSERLHQLALATLLSETNLLKHLGIEATPNPKGVGWEPSGGRFDLAVKLNDGRTAWVEIKVDSDLSQVQKESQFSFVFDHPERDGDHLIYLLLGACQHYQDAARLEGELNKRKGGHSGVAKVETASTLKALLERPDILPERPDRARDVRDLVAAYVEALFKLNGLFHHYAERPVGDWNCWDLIGVFARCRARIPSMLSANIEYVANPAGGFYACAWGDKPVDGGATLYLSFENDALRFKAFFPEPIGGPELRSPLWTSIHEKLMQAAQSAKIKLTRPRRVRTGWTMTVANVDPSPLHQEKDWQELYLVGSVIAEAEALVGRVAEAVRE